jgi:hypothetical protein
MIAFIGSSSSVDEQKGSLSQPYDDSFEITRESAAVYGRIRLWDRRRETWPTKLE